jgi:RHS repeat-associated protein
VRYVNRVQQTVAERDPAHNLFNDYLIAPGIDEVLAKRSADGSIAYYGADQLGSVVTVNDPSGNFIAGISYDTWGVTTGVPQLYGYTGREANAPGWYYRARYYDPQRGRFLSEDPIRSAEDPNLYVYVHSDPLSLTDPFGLCDWEIRRRHTHNAPDKRLVDHWYFHNTKTDQSLGLGPARNAVLATISPIGVDGIWETNEVGPKKDKSDEKIADVPDGCCNCVGKKVTNPGKPPDYCTIPAPRLLKLGTPCPNCQGFIKTTTSDCQCGTGLALP